MLARLHFNFIHYLLHIGHMLGEASASRFCAAVLTLPVNTTAPFFALTEIS